MPLPCGRGFCHTQLPSPVLTKAVADAAVKSPPATASSRTPATVSSRMPTAAAKLLCGRTLLRTENAASLMVVTRSCRAAGSGDRGPRAAQPLAEERHDQADDHAGQDAGAAVERQAGRARRVRRHSLVQHARQLDVLGHQ